MYTRAAASDYQDWETVYGNEGWGFTDLLPLFRKVRPVVNLHEGTLLMGVQCETYQVASNAEMHGHTGPLKVSYGGVFSNIGSEFLAIAGQYDKTRGPTDDPNSFGDVNKYGVRLTNIVLSQLVIAFLHHRNGRSTCDVKSGVDPLTCTKRFIDAKNGKRSDVAHHYIYNQEHCRNLVVKAGYIVKRVIFE